MSKLNKKTVVILGIIVVIAGISQRDPATFFSGVVIAVGGHFYFKRRIDRQNIMVLENKAEDHGSWNDALYTTYVTGLKYADHDKVLKKYMGPPYGGMTKREIEEKAKSGERVYEYSNITIPVSLVPEPKNEHDPNAIAVKLDGKKTIGYIKRTDTFKVRKYIDKNVVAQVFGGSFYFQGQDGKVMQIQEEVPGIALRFYERN